MTPQTTSAGPQIAVQDSTPPDLCAEFDRQVENLIQKGYPKLAGMTVEEFRQQMVPLKGKLTGLTTSALDLEEGRIPFVIVVKSDLVAAGDAMPLLELKGKAGIVSMYPVEPKSFVPVNEVDVPDGPVYLLVDIDRGKETLNVAPDQAIEMIREQGRSPLTIDEGMAVLTQFPEFLKKNNCFSLLASRRGDRRIPALWISEGRPKLGWCWAGNPHTWLGSASCRVRVGV